MDKLISSVVSKQQFKKLLFESATLQTTIATEYSKITKILIDKIGVLKKSYVTADVETEAGDWEEIHKLIIESISIIKREVSKFKSNSIIQLKKNPVQYDDEQLQLIINSFIAGVNTATENMYVIANYVDKWIKPRNSKIIQPNDWKQLVEIYELHVKYVEEFLNLMPQFDISKLYKYWKKGA